MKKLLGILVLGLFLITPSWADDIRDFQIEGVSLGDSLLDYITKQEIESKKKTDYKSKKFSRTYFSLSEFEIYDDLFTMDFNYEGRVYIESQNLEGENFLFNLRGYEPKIIKSQKLKTYSIVLMNRMKTYFVLDNVYFDFDKYDLNAEVKKYLDIIYTWLLKNQNLIIFFKII